MELNNAEVDPRGLISSRHLLLTRCWPQPVCCHEHGVWPPPVHLSNPQRRFRSCQRAHARLGKWVDLERRHFTFYFVKSWRFTQRKAALLLQWAGVERGALYQLPNPATGNDASGGRFQLHARAASFCLGAAFFAPAIFARFRRFHRFLYLKVAPSSLLADFDLAVSALFNVHIYLALSQHFDSPSAACPTSPAGASPCRCSLCRAPGLSVESLSTSRVNLHSDAVFVPRPASIAQLRFLHSGRAHPP